MEWRWTDDPLGEPDEEHARCIAAPGTRILEYCSHTFVLTTHACAPGTDDQYVVRDLHVKDGTQSHANIGD